MILNSDKAMIWKEVDMTYFKELSSLSLAETKENHKNFTQNS
jgi:hypothetical protein